MAGNRFHCERMAGEYFDVKKDKSGGVNLVLFIFLVNDRCNFIARNILCSKIIVRKL